MEVPSKLRKFDRDAKQGCLQLAEEVRTKNSGTGNARKPMGGSKCSAAIEENEFTFLSKSTNPEHESYSPTFLSPMDNSTGAELNALPITGHKLPADTCSHNPRLGENQHLQAFPTVYKNPLNGPALNIIWKGNFEIRYCPPNLGFCEGVLAHSSANVSRRAYSFSKQISENLHFIMYSRDQFLPDIFKMRCPDRDDIALYFYPGNYERSKRQYSSLLRFMDRKGLMLRSSMDSVELLVYPSSLLEVDSQKLGNCYFMWGVFHHIREDKSGSKAGAQCTLPHDKD